MRSLAAAVFALLPFVSQAGVLDDKTPGYFADRYGLAKSSKTESSTTFIEPGQGNVSVKGSFSVREFRRNDLRVEPVFLLPSLQLAAVRLNLGHEWTSEQVEAALIAYGGDWKRIKKGVLKTWIAPDGSMAVQVLMTLEIQSKTTVELVEKTLAESAAKRKAIPKF